MPTARLHKTRKNMTAHEIVETLKTMKHGASYKFHKILVEKGFSKDKRKACARLGQMAAHHGSWRTHFLRQELSDWFEEFMIIQNETKEEKMERFNNRLKECWKA